ncbi:MAG: transposase, partial [Myxococcota bacterium]
AANIAEVSGSCANLLAHFEAMWTFVERPGVEPTNNHAERELRPLVLWRRRCFGSQSKRGDHFAERMMTVMATAQKQRRRALDFLHQCLVATQEKAPPPRLLATAT